MLQHVSVEIRPDQEDACIAFWKLLGFEQMTPPPILRGHVTWVQRDGTLARLADGGYEMYEGSNAWDAPRTFVRDPAGNLFEVMSKSPQPPWPGE